MKQEGMWIEGALKGPCKACLKVEDPYECIYVTTDVYFTSVNIQIRMFCLVVDLQDLRTLLF